MPDDVTLQFSQAEKMDEEPEGRSSEILERKRKVEEVEVEEEVVDEEREEERWRAGAGG